MAASSIPCRWKYDAFVSFRGEDIRKGFMDHLFKDFKQKGIHAFRDDDELPRGEQISPQLYKAIEESRFLIVIFSKGYASSSWCLRELAKILECKKMENPKHEVQIIFYDVKPDVVRKQKRSYAEAFAKHEVLNSSVVAEWKKALSMAADLSGWDLQDLTNGYESKFIDSISKEILKKLCHGPLDVDENLVGVETLVSKMNLLRFIGSDKVHMFGIFGFSGIGKTTVAKAIYNMMYIHYEGSCFCEDVQGVAKHKGLTKVQMQLIDKIMKIKDVKLSNTSEGIMFIKQRMLARPILLVLDDVDTQEQLEALAGSPSWFFPGSLIIFTCKDNQLLKSHKVDPIYEMGFLNHDEALELFSLHAFGDEHPPEDFKQISSQVMQHVQGHPLTLKVLGRFLYDKPMPVWKSELEKLQVYPHAEIKEVLRLTFVGLDQDQQKIFLDIASYLIGVNKDLAVNVLDSCNFFAETNIRVLVDKALITISSTMSLQMHELIQAMARAIVREEANKPGDRSRLWIPSEVCCVLNKTKVTEAIEVLVLLLEKSTQKVHTDSECFARMNNLRILKICDVEQTFEVKLPKDFQVEYSGSLEFLSNELRLLYWHGCPFKFLPSSFYPENIVSIDMSYSHINNIWTTLKCFRRLKQMKLSHCLNITSTPNFTGITNLEELILEGCVNLVKVHPSIGILKRLVVLNLKNCKRLRSIPCKVETDSLQVLILSGCLQGDKLPESFSTIKTLVELHVDHKAITEFPHFIFAQTNLQVLSVGRHQRIEPRWWSSIVQSLYMQNLQQLPSLVVPSLSNLRFLKDLNLSYCNISELSPDIGDLSSLQFLELSGNNFTYLPPSLSQLSKLQYLTVDDCKKLEVFPKIPQSIFRFDAGNCTSLQELGNLPIMGRDFNNFFNLQGCTKLVENLKTLMSVLLPQGLNYLTFEQDVVLYQKRIPRRFTNQSKGNCVKVELPPGWCYNKFKGFETCVVFTNKKSYTYEDTEYPLEYTVNNFDGASLICESMTTNMEKMADMIGSNATWLQCRSPRRNWMKAKDFVMFVFKGSAFCEVKECGVRLIYGEAIIQETCLSNLLDLPTLLQDGGMFRLYQEFSSAPGASDNRVGPKMREFWWSSN